MKELQSKKSDITSTRIIEINSDGRLDENDILVKIEKFSFTANNVTYGVAGDTIGYWQFFPASENTNNEWGCIPMWGFAEIINYVLQTTAAHI